MSKRRELVERRRAQERQQTLIILGVIAAIALLLIGGAVVLSNKNNSSSASTNTLTADPRPTPPGAETNARAWGPADAPIKIEEYLDYQCPACGAYNRNYEAGVIDAFAKTGKVRYEVHSMSFIGQESIDAAQATLCAADQGKFWQMHDSLFTNQHGENAGDFTKDRLKTLAGVIGLDTSAFGTCMDTDKYADKITQERSEGEQRGVNQTPSFFVNGKLYVGTQSAADFKRIFSEVAPDVKLGN